MIWQNELSDTSGSDKTQFNTTEQTFGVYTARGGLRISRQQRAASGLRKWIQTQSWICAQVHQTWKHARTNQKNIGVFVESWMQIALRVKNEEKNNRQILRSV